MPRSTTEINEAAATGIATASEPTPQQETEKGKSMTIVNPTKDLPQPSDIAPPHRGAPDVWEGASRAVIADIGTVAVAGRHRDFIVTAFCEQFRDGRIGVVDVAIGDNTMSTAQARALAALLIEGADLADSWVDATSLAALSTVELLANAFSILRSIDLPDEAGEYVRAALDSISDATEVLG